MLIKFEIKRNNMRAWTMFDNVERYTSYYDEITVKSEKEFDDFLTKMYESESAFYKVFLDIKSAPPFSFRRIDFYSNDKKYIVFTDGLCFVMNNEGQTIERP